VKVAVLGLGSIGLRHSRNLLALEQDVVGFDPDPARRDALDSEGGASATSREAALEGVSAAVIASPNAAHLDDLDAVVGRGLHVFLEKPPAHSAAGLLPLVTRAEAASVVFFTGVNLRFSPAVRAAYADLAAGRIGEPIWARFLAASWLPDWRPQQDHTTGYTADPRTGGAIFDYFHEFDLAVHLLGPATPVAAAARSTGLLSIPAEDCADALLAHVDGPQSTIHVDYVSRVPSRYAEICGTEGMLRLDIARRTLEHTAPGQEPKMTEFSGDHAGDYVTEMRSFLDCVEGTGTPLCDGREALSVLQVVIACRKLCGLPA
jgi:predicted dehydrogenase